MAVIKLNTLRGEILRYLKYIYPNGMNQLDIVGIYYQSYRYDDIVTSLEYLADKKYVERTEFPHPYKPGDKVVWYKINPTGIDLIDGNIMSDPGITLVPEA
jgi:hypothetical protein